METLRQNIRFGLRMLVKSPAYTFVAILALALGIGANTAIFSVVYAVLLKPLPYLDSERLVAIESGNEQRGVEHQRLDLRGLENVGVVVQGAQRVQGRADAAGELHGGDVGQHLGAVGGDDRDPAARVLAQHLVEHGVADLVGDLVRVTLGHGLGGEETSCHGAATPFIGKSW